MQPAQTDNPSVLVRPPLLFASTLIIGGLLHLVFPVRLLPPQPARIAGSLIVCGAGFFALWAERVMKAAGTNIRPDKPALAVVTTGPFGFSRNPMYVSLCALQLGIALLINGVLSLVFLLPLILIGGPIAYEPRSVVGCAEASLPPASCPRCSPPNPKMAIFRPLAGG